MMTLLAKGPAVEKVNFSDTGMTTEALLALAEACGHRPALKELHFLEATR